MNGEIVTESLSYSFFKPNSLQGQCSFTDDQALRYGDKALKTGCSDGGREGFFQHPTVAGCKGYWWGRKNLRAKPSYVGATCGDDVGRWGRWCGQPADLCEDGWHVCGTFGDVFEIVNRVRLKLLLSKQKSYKWFFCQMTASMHVKIQDNHNYETAWKFLSANLKVHVRILSECEPFHGRSLTNDCNSTGHAFDIEPVLNLSWLVLRCDHKGNPFVIVCFKSEQLV